jgi:pilus assembly protein CpaC
VTHPLNPIRRRLALAALIALSAAGTPLAQEPAFPAPDQPQQAAPADDASGIRRLFLSGGRSIVELTDFDITRIAVTNPAVADATVVAPREILIDGKGSGTVSLIVWGPARRVHYDIVVQPAVNNLQRMLDDLFPGEDIKVSINDEATVLSGNVSSTTVMLRAGELAQASSSKSRVINMLQLPGGTESQQVMLQVRFAEVNRRRLMEAGISLFTTRTRFVARSTTQQFPAPNFNDTAPLIENDNDLAGLVFGDFLNLFFFDRQEGIGGVLRALRQSGAFQSLAEPNLIAYNGQEASFLAGGEFPVPVVQGNTGSVTIQFKEFGIRLTFTPTIAGDVIRLKVRPEVSALDFANGLTLSGFRVPALTTRRAETDVELRDGQSFAIAGLLDNISQEDRAAIPVLSALPIIGPLFKSKSERAERTELMVLITPRLVRPLEPDEVPSLPTDPSEFLPTDEGVGRQMEGGAGVTDAPAGVEPTPATEPPGTR